ncbi:MAG: hypothetical protein ACPK85_13980 [Methanosarcina sp.]
MKTKIKFLLLISIIYMAGFFLIWPETGTSKISSREIGEDLSGTDYISLGGSSPAVVDELTSSGELYRTYSWEYKGQYLSLSMPLNAETYNVYHSRTRNRDYDLFASDPYDDWLIKDIADTLYSLSKENGVDQCKVPELCVSFAQSLNYTSDLESSGFDQYPRFPYETLYENGGDCEDTSILSAAILQEMGYDVVLLELPEHMAVGINCNSEQKGKYFEYKDKKYYYLETTGRDWQIGELPEEYEGQPVKVIPVCSRPLTNLDFKAQCEYSQKEGIVDVNVSLKNVGSQEAKNTTIYVAIQAEDEAYVWDKIESDPFTVEPEGVYTYTARELTIPIDETFRVYVQAQGDNFYSENVTSEWVKI